MKKSYKLLLFSGAGGIFYSTIRFFSFDKKPVPTKDQRQKIFVQTDSGKDTSSYYLKYTLGPDGSFEIDGSPLPAGAFSVTALAGRPLIIVHSKDNFRVFNATCTHLGCMVQWDEDSNSFKCPCHGGEYDENGVVTAGPPPTNLKEYKVSVTDSVITGRLA